MWLPLVLLALMASCSACPDLCDCHPNGILFANTVIICRGRAPGLSEIPIKVRRLSVDSADIEVLLNELEAADLVNNSEMIGILDDTETNDTLSEKRANMMETLPSLVELAVTNCSLVSLNISWHGFERLKQLNLSCNNLLRIKDVFVETMNMSELMFFDLSVNSLSDISVGSFRTYVKLVRLSLRENMISKVDEGAFQGLNRLEFLDLSDNRLADLPDSALTPLRFLRKLDLSGNQLQVLGATWFESLDRLQELDVSRNGLARAASGTLQPLSGLSVLKLAGNPLKEKDVSLLLGTGRRLETVDASHTGLAGVPAALTRSVRMLTLAGNRLSTIRSGDLDSYPLLHMLDMADNRLVDIENDALGRLEVLEELSLSGNILPKVPGSLPSSLVMLQLERNAITALKLNDFNGLYNLRWLILKNNDISEIEVGALGELPLLSGLDLSDNPIKMLPSNTLSGPIKLGKLWMSGLTSLQRHQEEQSDMAFPVPTPEKLNTLDVSRSPVLAEQLLADDATLSACKSLTELNLSETGITSIRSDLAYMLPQLRVLRLAKNHWDCTEDLYWLGEWIRQHKEPYPSRYEAARCSKPQKLSGLFLYELPSPPTSVPTTAGITLTNTIITMSALFVLKHTDQPNVTMSSTSDTANSNNSVMDLSTLPSLNSKTERKTEAAAADLEDVLHAETISTTATSSEIYPRVYEAPTSFRNVTSSSIMTRMNREPSRKSDKTNRILMQQNLIKHIVVAVSQKPDELSITKDDGTYAQTFDNQIDGSTGKNERTSEAAASPAEMISTESTRLYGHKHAESKGKRTIEGYSARMNYTTKENAMLDDRDSDTIAEELNSRATDSGARVSEALSAGAHPGMLVLAGAALGAIAALTVVLSRRATMQRMDRYHRHENIEVHTLTPTAELW